MYLYTCISFLSVIFVCEVAAHFVVFGVHNFPTFLFFFLLFPKNVGSQFPRIPPLILLCHFFFGDYFPFLFIITNYCYYY
ncbi:hypothetical protein, unlikely [Trypanosoma brucei gambiense DAL972]|uniref:Uncharacterized protein n=1 Tax=Trypanosoma brucei gambiense (strain MHOM/CI/86/DAL972) TaxID=679716 RepID=C9ZI53_TRYB9|nr:hypothetical protein, unlikely [Trypanosoma brucei gambiense DAL972]CBH09170.1 hypothetical protein, unlikely [Trypanosoma brucei gambiense DAL972]|eukprot:XP_011771611.1 hypothetical protein, unlikely [Trypanosoma brucei gambiense DAL972]